MANSNRMTYNEFFLSIPDADAIMEILKRKDFDVERTSDGYTTMFCDVDDYVIHAIFRHNPDHSTVHALIGPALDDLWSLVDRTDEVLWPESRACKKKA